MGIDVGGTHTKAVAIDNDTYDIIGKVQVHTTHDDKAGVAKGVVECFQKCLKDNDISPEDVIFIAHSTTQATNALLEGDVAKVGIVAGGETGFTNLLAKKQTTIGHIPLVTGRYIETYTEFIDKKNLNKEEVRKRIKALRHKGAEIIVGSEVYGVDDNKLETMVAEVAEEEGFEVTQASEISKLYGLATRTRTAAVNASILPKMLETANSTEESVKATGIKAPLMIMRGDGGVMSCDEMRKRPILSMMSGPTASVVGALMYLRASVGIYFEVGGTSTNIGVIKNGRPTIKHSELAGHRTYVNALDVRVLGVAGGSMVRANNHNLVDVGPRSAHIAGLAYSAFAKPEDIVDPELYFVEPKAGDPSDYVAIKCSNGKRYTITNTCAANVLGLTSPEFYAYGNQEAARKAMKPLADFLNLTVEECATQILRKACAKLIPVVKELIEEYKLDEEQAVLVGCGGGAASLIPFMGKEMGIKYKIPQYADVISSIGVAMAMVRDSVERVIPNPSESDIAAVRKEAIESAIKLGADPNSIETIVEIDNQTQRVSVTAIGSTEVKTTDMRLACDEQKAKEIAAQSMGAEMNDIKLAGKTDSMFVFAKERMVKKMFHKTELTYNLRVIDSKGFVKLQFGNASINVLDVGTLENKFKKVFDKLSTYKGDVVICPDLFIVVGGRIIEVVGVNNLEQAKGIINAELAGIPSSDPVILIGVRQNI
ncbi:MAG TPA: hydantoinase/oxoprolinase family protein [Candidatus Merdenecus merdavium]|nr:hydantoinase/oxoprolinase family protein [Candidatus Merdenecus merdavium]